MEGGVERHVANLSKQLALRGHDVEVFTCARTRQGDLLERSSMVEGLRVSRFDSYMSLGEFGKVWPGFAPRVLKGGYDVVHSHSFRHPHTDVSLVASKFSRSASVLTSHSPFHPAEVRGPFARALVPVYDNLVAPTTLGLYDKVISLTTEEASQLERIGARPKRTVIIPHGIDDIHFQPASASLFTRKFGLEGKRFLLCLSRINKTKGLDVLLEAFARLAPEAKDVSLVLAGGCTSEREQEFLFKLRARSEALGIQDRVVFTGRLSEEEKSSAYEGCLAFVLPSIYEPFGIVLLEAAAHGKPLVSTRAGGPLSIISEGINGLLVAPGDSDQLYRVLARIVSDQAGAETMGSNARVFAKKHTWESVAASTERAYLSVARKGKR